MILQASIDHATISIILHELSVLPILLTLYVLGNFSSADFFQNYFFRKILAGTHFEYHTAWIQIRAAILLVLIWVQTVCKGYQQTTRVVTSKERVNSIRKHVFKGQHYYHLHHFACYDRPALLLLLSNITP